MAGRTYNEEVRNIGSECDAEYENCEDNAEKDDKNDEQTDTGEAK